MANHSIYKFKIPLYFGHLRIVISDDFDQTCKDMKLLWTDFKASNYDAFVWPNDSEYTVYNMMIKPTSSSKIIAHESLHVVNMIFKDRGMALDVDNDEPQAYLLGWVVECVDKAIFKNKKRS